MAPDPYIADQHGVYLRYPQRSQVHAKTRAIIEHIHECWRLGSKLISQAQIQDTHLACRREQVDSMD